MQAPAGAALNALPNGAGDTASGEAPDLSSWLLMCSGCSLVLKGGQQPSAGAVWVSLDYSGLYCVETTA